MKRLGFRDSDSLGNPSLFVEVAKTEFRRMPPHTVPHPVHLIHTHFVGNGVVKEVSFASSLSRMSRRSQAPF